MKQLSKYIQLITNIEALKFGKGLDRNFDKNRGRVGNRRNYISAMLADSRCIEGEIPGYCTTPLHNIGGADPGILRYINNNALQISQHGGYLILSISTGDGLVCGYM